MFNRRRIPIASITDRINQQNQKKRKAAQELKHSTDFAPPSKKTKPDTAEKKDTPPPLPFEKSHANLAKLREIPAPNIHDEKITTLPLKEITFTPKKILAVGLHDTLIRTEALKDPLYYHMQSLKFLKPNDPLFFNTREQLRELMRAAIKKNILVVCITASPAFNDSQLDFHKKKWNGAKKLLGSFDPDCFFELCFSQGKYPALEEYRKRFKLKPEDIALFDNCKATLTEANQRGFVCIYAKTEGKIQDPSAIKYLQEYLEHVEPRVEFK